MVPTIFTQEQRLASIRVGVGNRAVSPLLLVWSRAGPVTMETINRLYHERHFDWSPIRDAINGESGRGATDLLNGFLGRIGWPTPYPEPEQWALCISVSVGTLLAYFLLFHRNKSASIAKKLDKAKSKVAKLEAQLKQRWVLSLLPAALGWPTLSWLTWLLPQPNCSQPSPLLCLSPT